MRGKEFLTTAVLIGMALNGCSEANSPTALPPAIERTQTAELQSQWMAQLQAYGNKEIPASLVRKIATDMANSSEYPSLAASGNLLINQYDNPQKVLDLLPFPEAKDTFPMHFIFSDQFGDRSRAFMRISGDDTAQEITLIDKSTGQTLKFMGVKEHSTRYDIFLNTHLIDVNASQWAYKLLLAKEASHLLYLRPQMDDVWSHVTQKYDVVGGEEEKPILFETGHAVGNPRLNIPKLGTHFDRAHDLLDYTGYWHINADVAKMNRQGKLTPKDQQIFEANITMANLSISKGLIVFQKNGDVKWKEGIGPFSDEWITIVDQALKK